MIRKTLFMEFPAEKLLPDQTRFTIDRIVFMCKNLAQLFCFIYYSILVSSFSISLLVFHYRIVTTVNEYLLLVTCFLVFFLFSQFYFMNSIFNGLSIVIFLVNRFNLYHVC